MKGVYCIRTIVEGVPDMADDFSTDNMLDMYLYENGQLLEQLEEIVLENKDEDSFDENNINEIFRIMHTIKGSSGVMKYDDIMKTSHKLEDIFYFLRENRNVEEHHMELTEIIFRVLDFINGEMDKIKDGNDPDGDSSELIADMEKFLAGLKDNKQAPQEDKQQEKEESKITLGPNQFYIAPQVSGADKYYRVRITYQSDTQMCNLRAYSAVYAVKELTEDVHYSPEDILTNEASGDEILRQGFLMLVRGNFEEDKLRTVLDTTPEIDKIDISACDKSEFDRGFTAMEAPSVPVAEPTVENKAETEPQPGDYVIQKEAGKAKQITKTKKKKEHKQAFMSVNIDKMNLLMNLMGEMVIAESVVLQNPDLQVPGLDLSNFQKAAAQMSKITTEMQELIMSMRMMPLTNTFQKMNRTVFDISRKLGKDIEFEMIGDTTEVDKNIIEHISDPLMHLVRNSMDHGIETNEERLASDKQEKAKVTLSAKTESGKVWISVADNGKGLDRGQIMAKARQQGLLEPGRPESSYTDKEVYQFITLPGFSTNKKVTEFSGRGVGMDVVVSNLQKIGGTLEIDSVPGQGSTMNLKIPLTLAIIDGIVMDVGDSSFVMETGAVREFVHVTEDMLIHEPDGRESVMIRGACYPVIRLGDFYELHDYETKIENGMMVLVEIEKNVVCLFVDRLVGKQEIVVKPIPKYIKKVKGLSGCTQLGDGSIALILDAAGLMEY